MRWPLSQDFNEAIQNPRTAFADPDLRGGETVVGATGLPLPRSGNFADVYQVRGADGRDWAVKCFTRPVAGLAERYAKVSEALATAGLRFTVGFTFLAEGVRVGGAWCPVVKMEWVEGLLLNQVAREKADKPETLAKLGRLWVKLCKRLRDAGVAHADVQHGNVILVPGGEGRYGLKLIDYDGMWVPALANTPSGESGHPSYQHPARAATRTYSPDVDRFPHLVVATALKGLAVGGSALWEKYDNGDNLLFIEEDYKKPADSKVMKDLWNTGDPNVQSLVGRLALACGNAIPQTPWLDQLAPDGEPSPLDDATRREAAAALGFGSPVAVGVDWASPGESPVPASFEVVPVSSAPVPAELSPPPKPLRERESSRRSKASVAEEAEPDEAPTPNRSRKPGDKSRRPRSRQQIPVWVWGAAAGLLVCVIVGAVLAFRPKSEQTVQTKPDEESVKPTDSTAKDSGRSPNLDLPKPPPANPDPAVPNPPKKEAPLLPDVTLPRPRQEVTWDIAPGVKMVFCWIPPGKFQMGSDHSRGNSNEKPVHHVTITKGFWMAQTEVTQTQWNAVMGTNPSQFKGANRPVESVSWNDCQNYCKKLTANLKGRATVRLPTEAEWEYACRAGTTTEYHFGDVLNTELANYNGNDSWNGSPKGKFRQQTTDVGSFSANPWGLCDMHGNVFEWCEDSYGTYQADDQSDPQGQRNAGDRVLRGGSWKLNPNSCRAATRYIFAPGNAYNDFGFRVCFHPVTSPPPSRPTTVALTKLKPFLVAPLPAGPVQADQPRAGAVMETPLTAVRRVFPPLDAKSGDACVLVQTNAGLGGKGEKLALDFYGPSGNLVPAARIEFDGDGSAAPIADMSVSTKGIFFLAANAGKLTVWATADKSKLLDAIDPYADKPEHAKAGLAAAFFSTDPSQVVTVSTGGAVLLYDLPTRKVVSEFVPPNNVPGRVALGLSVAKADKNESVVIAVSGVLYQLSVAPGLEVLRTHDLGGDVGRSLGLAVSGTPGRLLYVFETVPDKSGKKDRAVLGLPLGDKPKPVLHPIPAPLGEPKGALWSNATSGGVILDRGVLWFDDDEGKFQPLVFTQTPGNALCFGDKKLFWFVIAHPKQATKSVLVAMSVEFRDRANFRGSYPGKPLRTVRIDHNGLSK